MTEVKRALALLGKFMLSALPAGAMFMSAKLSGEWIVVAASLVASMSVVVIAFTLNIEEVLKRAWLYATIAGVAASLSLHLYNDIGDVSILGKSIVLGSMTGWSAALAKYAVMSQKN